MGVICGHSLIPFRGSLQMCASVIALGFGPMQARGKFETQGAPPWPRPQQQGGQGQKTICKHDHTGLPLLETEACSWVERSLMRISQFYLFFP